MADRYEESSGAVIFYLENNEPFFLLLKYPSYWGFAKGLIEKDENIEQTMRREVEEETGLKDVELLPGFSYIQEWFYRFEGKLVKKKAVFLLAKVDKKVRDTIKLSYEHEAFEWNSFEEAIKKMKIKNNRGMLTSAYNFIKENHISKGLQ
jgi:8-oxo-dGTP pyrophosphatase MutT (NUDIX family)